MNPIATALLLLIALTFFGQTMHVRIGALLAMRPENRWDQLGARLGQLLAFGFGQKRMLDPEERTPGVMHFFVFGAFLILAARTVMLFVMGFSQDAMALLGTGHHAFWESQPLLGSVFRSYLLLKDVAAAAALLGALYFVWMRARVKPARLTVSWEAYLILGFISALMVTEFVFGASRLLSGAHGFVAYEPVTSGVAALLSPLFTSSPAGVMTIGNVCFWIHLTIILAFLNFLPWGKHFHVITGLPSVFFGRLSPSGKLSTPNLEKEEFGAKTVHDLTWKQGLDLYSCTECGRCQTHCPTYITGKPLTHKAVNQDLKHWIWDNPQLATRTPTASGAPAEVPAVVGNILKPETVWACTTCGWCEQACPVFIENVPRLVDMRRYKVQVEADFPAEAQRVFEGIERQGNPWGIGQDRRDEWAQDLSLPQWGDGGDYEYLFYVGCAGSYDDRQKKVSRALVKIMREAGVKFATLGKSEMCNAETVRRLGNEYLFQTVAKANVEAWNGLGVKAVITQCPHCFNTLKNEYPDFGGHYKVISHTELLSDLIREGRVKLTKASTERLTFHDPCYLGRHNGVFDAPREALAAIPGLQVVEMQRSKRQSFCCGAGGGRMWLEEKIGTRINHNRANEVALTLAHAENPSVPFPSAVDKDRPGKVGDYTGQAKGTVAVACPFCATMLRDAMNDTAREGIQVRDIAELVADAMTRP